MIILFTRWDGHTTKKHPVTGKEVPDETAQTPVYDYINPEPAEWPNADFVIGNPPFIGAKYIREALGDGYAEALRKAYKGTVPDSADFVMYWWHKAADYTRSEKAERFGFITTNSIRQVFNRRVLESYLNAKEPISIIFAIPDHPWVDSADGAAVEIAMTTGVKGESLGRILTVISESSSDGVEANVDFTEKRGKVQSDLTVGRNLTSVVTLQSNEKISSPGVKLHGAGFIISHDQAVQLGLERILDLDKYIKEYRNGKDLTDKPRGVKVIDLYGLDIDYVRDRFPEVYQRLYEVVKPERALNNRVSYKTKWWIHGEPRGTFRPVLHGLSRFIATVVTSKHRTFQFLNSKVLPDDALVNIASSDAYLLGVLSSKIHGIWALAKGSNLGGNTPRYIKTTCFETFPFPSANEEQKSQIRSIGESLDAHRKRQQVLHTSLTITEMYNVLQKLRVGEPLSSKDQKVHEQGLVSVLLQLHNELDAAVTKTYGWPLNLTEEEVLEKLVQLNRDRASEEARGIIRWLRPEYQNPQGVQQAGLNIQTNQASPDTVSKELTEWPKNLADQAQIVQRLVQQNQHPISSIDLSKNFSHGGKASKARELQIENLLHTLNSLGLIRKTENGSYIK